MPVFGFDDAVTDLLSSNGMFQSAAFRKNIDLPEIQQR